MTAVDTGWITDERPHYTKLRLADEGFHAPLDLVDGAARSTTRSCRARRAWISTVLPQGLPAVTLVSAESDVCHTGIPPRSGDTGWAYRSLPALEA